MRIGKVFSRGKRKEESPNPEPRTHEIEPLLGGRLPVPPPLPAPAPQPAPPPPPPEPRRRSIGILRMTSDNARKKDRPRDLRHRRSTEVMKPRFVPEQKHTQQPRAVQQPVKVQPAQNLPVNPRNDQALLGELNVKSIPNDALNSRRTPSSGTAETVSTMTGGGSTSKRSHGVATPERDHGLDTPQILASYAAIPVLEQTKLPRGGVSVDTTAVGRVQFGIPPETIKDSMRLGIPVPQVYIVPVERFCREMGPALGVNLAEFEFPAYFNFFVYKKRCTLIVDSDDAEENIRRVFSETLLGPAQFRNGESPIEYEQEDFSPDFPREAIPNFQRELKHFRIMPDGRELVIETLLNFCHFECRTDGVENLGFPPPLAGNEEIKIEQHTPMVRFEEEEEEVVETCVPANLSEVEKMEKNSHWTYSQARFMGDVATVWPFTATPEQIKERKVPRVEIFKMPGGTEYIVHDIDENNHIVGKARISGHVRVSEFMSVDGFGGHSFLDDFKGDDQKERPVSFKLKPEPTNTFHPPSFGVTVLGNSHGFDKSGSVSGYVLWINGRGVMIDPPPYSSATLEREGIRPRTIVGIILTHCHADHDAGAFQKVLTGSPVVVITTPTIYKSFIRKYAALSALSPALLRHSHRYKPAIIGQPLRFQGATFHFTYTLHTIPCVGFRVEWRGRSMVFTGDHFNSPPDLDKLEEAGVLSKARADDLRQLPLQETDVLLHEAGAPPIHTPLHVLEKLPERVKNRLYVVHTSALPEGCTLKVAPTGTGRTIRLDQSAADGDHRRGWKSHYDGNSSSAMADDAMAFNSYSEYSKSNEDSWNEHGVRSASELSEERLLSPIKTRQNSMFVPDLQAGMQQTAPLVSLRPASSTDAWFILNLLSAVPFLSSLSYASTMEVLETARVDAYAANDVIIPASRRSQVLCVIWEGTCTEIRAGTNPQSHHHRNRSASLATIDEKSAEGAVWHAGDWTGPIALQPDRALSGESDLSETHDVVAFSSVGVKVISVEFSSLHSILRAGSPLYRKYLDRKVQQERAKLDMSSSENYSTATDKLLDDAMRNLNILELLNYNSALRKLTAVQKRHLESLAEGPISYQAGERLWRAGTPVDKAYILVSGTASFVPRRRNAGSASVSHLKDSDKEKMGDPSVGDSMRVDAIKAMKELGVKDKEAQGDDHSSMSSMEATDSQHITFDTIFTKTGTALSHDTEYAKISRGLLKRAEYLMKEGVTSSDASIEGSCDDGDSFDTENEAQLDFTFADESESGDKSGEKSRRASVIRRRSSSARKANKAFGRLYSRRAYTGGLVFSRGHFLGDVSKMVAGLLASDTMSENQDSGPIYGFGDRPDFVDQEHGSLAELIIHEQEGDHHIMHSSTLTAGKEGCVVLVFPKSSLIPFLDEYPGVLLSLLGTQVVV